MEDLKSDSCSSRLGWKRFHIDDGRSVLQSRWDVGFAVGFFESGFEFDLEGTAVGAGVFGFFGGHVAGEAAEFAGNFKEAGGVGGAKFFGRLLHGEFEDSFGGGDAFLGCGPFFFLKFGDAAEQKVGMIAMGVGFDGEASLKEGGLVVADPLGPLEFTRPCFDAADADARKLGNVRQGTIGANVEVGKEGGEGAVGFALGGSEREFYRFVPAGRFRAGTVGGWRTPEGGVPTGLGLLWLLFK